MSFCHYIVFLGMEHYSKIIIFKTLIKLCLNIPSEENYKQLEFHYDCKSEQLTLNFDFDEEISLENKLKKILNTINKQIEIKFIINTYINQNKYIYDKRFNI